MDEDLILSQASFGFRLEGESEIDATLVANTIRDIAELAKLITKEEDPEAHLKMNVTAFKNGSFQIDFSAICQTASTILTISGIAGGLALSVVSTIKGIIEIKKHLKGKEVKKVEPIEDNKIAVENCDGNIIIAPKSSGIVINNYQVDNLTMNIAYYAQQHNPKGGFTLITEQDSVECNAEDIKTMVLPLPITIKTLCMKNRIDAKLYIKKPTLLGHSSWEFVYNNRSIHARIEDEGFIETVSSGNLAMKSGDFIMATLEIENDLDKNNEPIPGTDKYCITKVHGNVQHEKVNEQLMLPEEAE